MTMLDFSRLVTPPHHGDTLVEPPPREHPAILEANRRMMARASADFAGLDLQTVRRQVRTEVVGEPDAPIVVTGHQPEFIHPGVWAKHVVAARLAAAMGGAAVNLVADNDVPKETGLAVPTVEDGRLNRRIVPSTHAPTSFAYENRPAAAVAERQAFEARVRTAMGPRFESSMLGDYFAALLGEPTHPVDWVDQTVAARRAVEQAVGITILDRRISRVWYGPMLAELIRDAGRFAAAYNGALADYRREQGVRSPQHPIPDLKRSDTLQELPLWAYRPGEGRRRLYAAAQGGRVELRADDPSSAGGRVIGRWPQRSFADWGAADAALRSAGDWRIRPRALMLTLWARLLLADLFVQGIGGAKYDRITDRLIRRYYGFEPPLMMAVSATLHLALPRHDLEPAAARALRRRRRDMIYNPQRQMNDSAAMQSLYRQKTDALGRLEALRGGNRSVRPRRRELFLTVRALNDRMRALDPHAWQEQERRLEETIRRLRENEIATRRDYFFALHRRSDLEWLRDRLPSVRDFGL